MQFNNTGRQTAQGNTADCLSAHVHLLPAGLWLRPGLHETETDLVCLYIVTVYLALIVLSPSTS